MVAFTFVILYTYIFVPHIWFTPFYNYSTYNFKYQYNYKDKCIYNLNLTKLNFKIQRNSDTGNQQQFITKNKTKLTGITINFNCAIIIVLNREGLISNNTL